MIEDIMTDKLLKVLSDEQLRNVAGGSGSATPQMIEAVNRLTNQVNEKYTQWVALNPQSTNIERVNKYNQLLEESYNVLSIDDRQLIDEYIELMN